MSQKRDCAGQPFFHQAGESHAPSTLRSIEVAEEIAPDTEQMVGPVYVEPLPLVAPSDHKTLEIQTIKLAEDIDPRKLPTELRLVRPPSVPPDSLWPPSEEGLAATQPPFAERRRSRARVAVAVLLALLLLGTALAWRGRVANDAARAPASNSALAAAPIVPLAPVAPSTAVAVVSVPAPADWAASTSAAAATSNATAAPSASFDSPPPSRHALRTVKNKAPTPTSPRVELASPNLTKPKRAIY